MTTDVLYDRAIDAIERENYDYAIDLLYQLLEIDPSNVKAHQTLWLAVKRKFGPNGPSKIMAAIKGIGPWLVAAFHGVTGKKQKLILACERYLMVNPRSAAMRGKLAQAAEALEDIETAIAASESAREISPTNTAMLKQLGNLYRARFDADENPEDLDKAIGRFEELLQATPNDHETKNTVQALAAQRAINIRSIHLPSKTTGIVKLGLPRR